jgi:CubicO group peptidase (beta-lactamase class C family)
MSDPKSAFRQLLKNFSFAAVAVVLGIGANTLACGADLARDSKWAAATPEEVGMDSGALGEMFDAVRQREIPVHSIQIVRHGRMALDAYFYPFRAGLRHDVASVTKSVTSTLVGLAIDRGHLRHVKQPVLSFFPNARVAGLDASKKSQEIAHARRSSHDAGRLGLWI